MEKMDDYTARCVFASKWITNALRNGGLRHLRDGCLYMAFFTANARENARAHFALLAKMRRPWQGSD